jgi:SAM-dependent methyltransferase
MNSDGSWESEAENWVRWARTPGHDEYWYYGTSFFDHIVPAPGRHTLEIGCGEGRVARDLTRRGHRVAAVDASATLVRHAQEADPGGHYLVADAAALPFADGAFDVVVAYNSLMDVADMPAAVREAARVLAAGGRFCICVTHPLSNAGGFSGEEPDAAFVIDRPYLEQRPFEGYAERDGLRMTFRGQCYPLEAYAQALAGAGLLIEALREPAASVQVAAAQPSYCRWQRLPMFLHLRAVKPPS